MNFKRAKLNLMLTQIKVNLKLKLIFAQNYILEQGFPMFGIPKYPRDGEGGDWAIDSWGYAKNLC